MTFHILTLFPDMVMQGMNTSIWIKFDKAGYENFIDLRTDSHAQAEIREVANHMLEFAPKFLQ